MFEISVDESHGHIRAKSWGVWTLDAADRYEAELVGAAETIRRSFDRVKMLHDAREQAVQPSNVTARFERTPSWISSPHDRLAILVTTSLHKMQVRRLFSDTRIQAFPAPEAAQDWLDALPSIRRI